MKQYQLIQISSHLGEHKDGVEKGPARIVSDFKNTKLFTDKFEPEIVSITHPDPDPELEVGEFQKLKHLPQVVESYAEIYTAVSETIKSGYIPVNVMGSDEPAAAVFNAVATHHDREDVGIVWLDSHPDINTAETTISGNIHGMSLALGVGIGHPDLLKTRPEKGFVPQDAVSIAAGDADMDPGEFDFVRDHGLLRLSPENIRDRGVDAIVAEVSEYFKSKGKTKLAFHFDLDSIDPAESPGVSVPAEDGNTFAEVYGITKGLLAQFELTSFDLAEYNPTNDSNSVTLQMALEILHLLRL